MKTKRKSSKHQSSLIDDVDLLTPKQRVFADRYLANNFNATEAYISAFGAGKSKAASAVSASKLLKNAKVARYISQKQDDISQDSAIDAKRVLQEIAKIAFLDPRKLLNSDGSVKQISELDDDAAASIAGFEVCELFDGQGEQKHAYGLSKKVKQADKLRALEMLGKHLKLFTDKSELSGPDGGPIETVSSVIVNL